MDVIIGYVVGQLNSYLEYLKKMEPLAPAGAPKSAEEHEAWMAQFEQVRATVHDAEICAMTVLPTDVAQVLQAINVRKAVLLGLYAMPEDGSK